LLNADLVSLDINIACVEVANFIDIVLTAHNLISLNFITSNIITFDIVVFNICIHFLEDLDFLDVGEVVFRCVAHSRFSVSDRVFSRLRAPCRTRMMSMVSSVSW
jgi:hypothetical protein